MEAALVMPIVIAAVMIVFYVVIALYMEIAGSVSLHISVRSEAAERAGTEIGNHEFQYFSPADNYGEKAYNVDSLKHISKGLFFDSVKGSNVLRAIFPGILGRDMNMKNDASYYIIEETEYIRCIDLLKKEDRPPYS